MLRRAFLASALGLLAAPEPYAPAAGDFSAWVAGYRARALAHGLSPATVTSALAGLSPDPRVLALDSRQPEFSKSVGDYVTTTAGGSRAVLGRTRLNAVAPRLAPAVLQGVPLEMLAGVWGVESNYGALQGDFDVVRSLATQAAGGRRAAWAESQLTSALRILDRGEVGRVKLRGSWAGAMGQTQFTPEDYLTWAVDGDGDGRRDIWGSAPDALASAANFLRRKAAWRPGESWAREVRVPAAGFDYLRVEQQALTPGEWARLGVRAADGGGFRPADAVSPARLLLPMGWRGPGFLAFPNHYAIRVYNNSTSYALAVGMLADRIGGAGPLVQAWPAEPPLSVADRMGAQQALAKLGFDPGEPDGVLGTATRKATRGWQSARGLPADGYLSPDLIRRLRGEAGV